MRAKLGILVCTLATGGVLFINVCDLVFDCGCRSLWNGASTYCNVHDDTPPHCPWCERPLVGGASAFALASLVQALVVFVVPHLGLATRMFLALIAFLSTGAVVGAVQAWWWNYPG